VRLRVKWKFFWALILASSAALIVAGILVSRQTEKIFLRQVEESLFSEAKLIESQFKIISLTEINISQIDSLADELGSKISARVTIVDAKGRVLGDSYKSGPELLSLENHLLRPEIQEALENQSGKNVRFSQTVRMKMLCVALPIKQGNQTVGFARLALPLTLLSQQDREIIKIVLLALLVSFLFSLTLSIALASRLTKPIRTMTESARQISQGNFKIKIKPHTQDEISELANYFNQMSSQLESTITLLKIEKLQLDSILSNMKEGVLALNARGEILLANTSLLQIFSLSPDILHRMYFESFRHPGLSELARSVLSERQNRSAEISLGFPQERFLLTEAIAIEAPNQEQVSAILVFFDITKLKRLEKVRKDFVANASHELRTPLTSIKGFVEALQDGAIDDPSQARQFLEIISRQAERMGKIIADMLLLSEIESEGFQLKLEEFQINDLIREVVKPVQAQAKSRNIVLELNLQEPEMVVKADQDKIFQVLSNLLDNALKFTSSGGKVAIKAEDHKNEVVIQVKDSGIGIPSTDLSRIFERFYTVDKSRSRELGGTGLGLSIVKHIVEAHGGKVWAESALNEGSTFYFSLPK